MSTRTLMVYTPKEKLMPHRYTDLVASASDKGYSVRIIDGNGKGAIAIGNKWWSGNLDLAVEEALDFVETH